MADALRNILETSCRPGFNRMCLSHSQMPKAHPVVFWESEVKKLLLKDLLIIRLTRLWPGTFPRSLSPGLGCTFKTKVIQSQRSGCLSSLTSPKAGWAVIDRAPSSSLAAPGTFTWLFVLMGKVRAPCCVCHPVTKENSTIQSIP